MHKSAVRDSPLIKPRGSSQVIDISDLKFLVQVEPGRSVACKQSHWPMISNEDASKVPKIVLTLGWSHSSYSALPHTSQQPHQSLAMPATHPTGFGHSSGLQDTQSLIVCAPGCST